MFIKAVFFDFGATLADPAVFQADAERAAVATALGKNPREISLPDYQDAVEAAWQSSQTELKDRWLTLSQRDSQESGVFMLGGFAERLIRQLGTAAKNVSTEDVFKAFLEGVLSSDCLYSDVKNTLSQLRKKYRLGIISNNMIEYVEGPARVGSIEDFFDVVVISGREGLIKPDREIFDLSCQRMGCQPDECVMVGDYIADDIIGGAEAGLHTIWVDRQRTGTTPEMAVAVICEIAELPEALEKLEETISDTQVSK